MSLRTGIGLLLGLIMLGMGWAWWSQPETAVFEQMSAVETGEFEAAKTPKAKSETQGTMSAGTQERAEVPESSSSADSGVAKKQSEGIASRREAYLEQVKSESLSEAFRVIVSEQIPPLFSRIGIDSGTSQFYPEHALFEFSRDPRAARLMEVARMGSNEDRELLYALARDEIADWTDRYNDTSMDPMERVFYQATNSRAIVPYLLAQSSENPLQTASLLYGYVSALQQAYSEMREIKGWDSSELTSPYVNTMASNIAVEMLRSQLFDIASQRDRLFPGNNRAQEVMADYEAFHAEVTSRQQHRLQASYEKVSQMMGGRIDEGDIASSPALDLDQLLQSFEVAAIAGEATNVIPVPPSVAGLSGYEAIIEFYRLFSSAHH